MQSKHGTAGTERKSKMDEYITKEQVIDWFSPYGHTDEPIPFEVLAADLRGCIPAADVAPVRHGRWLKHYRSGTTVREGFISSCCDMWNERKSNYCPNCGAKMDLEDEP